MSDSVLSDVLEELKAREVRFAQELEQVGDLGGANERSLLEQMKHGWAGRKGHVAELLSRLPALPPEARKEFGKSVNEFKKRVEAAIAERESALAATRAPAGARVTLPGAKVRGPHPRDARGQRWKPLRRMG